ncbi:MAG: hypothetical protein ASARMPREDX12_001483 [Alectoria sarmentosa]|nr:MAG: hypothetical protein ASARMPREDX12_001483 [Alectoria sarmentosa]
MDRLTATSTAPPAPNWPLPSFPPLTLINVPKESKRHCRLLPAGMVSLNLTQMADVRNHGEHQKPNYKKGEFTEHEFERWAFERKKARKTKKKQGCRREIEQKVNIEEKKSLDPNSFDEMIDAVDTLLASLTSPTEAIIEQPPPQTASDEIFAVDESMELSSPMAEIKFEIAELDAEETAIIPKPSSSSSSTHAETGTKIAEPETTTHHTTTTAADDGLAAATTTTTTTSKKTLDPTTALHSHPPSASERAFARDLSSARMRTSSSSKPGWDARMNALTRFDALTQYGMLATKKKKTKMTKLSFCEAVHRGFREVFRGGERCW